MIGDNHIYPKGDLFGYYGKDLWYAFLTENPEIAEAIIRLCMSFDHMVSHDSILHTSSHIQHRYYRIACLLGLAEWPDVQG